MKSERLASIILGLIFVGLPAAAFGYQQFRTAAAGSLVIDLEAQLPEAGGWQPEVLRIPAGEPVRFRIHSPDVWHSFAIGRTDIGPIDILPGQVTEIDVLIDEPGTYTFFCTRWCSTNHWRMRGTLEVVAPDGTVPPSSREPAPYIALGLDLDKGYGEDEHQAENEPVATPDAPPSAAQGATLGLPAPYVSLSDTPADVYRALRAANPDAPDADLWDLTAYAWRQAVSDNSLALGDTLYNRDCAACHGLDGRGDGIMARDLAEAPADWTEPVFMFGVSDALLHGKIVRGGMGTGMPGWGDIYTDDEAWALVAFLRTFALTGH
jgi:mono/diheme cytochrome c family protein